MTWMAARALLVSLGFDPRHEGGIVIAGRVLRSQRSWSGHWVWHKLYMMITGQAIVSVQRPNGIGSLTYVFHTPRYTSDLIGKFDTFNFAALSSISRDLVRDKTHAASPGLVNVS